MVSLLNKLEIDRLIGSLTGLHIVATSTLGVSLATLFEATKPTDMLPKLRWVDYSVPPSDIDDAS